MPGECDGPRVAVTMGDPAGIGPEIIIKTVNELPPADRRRLLLVADPLRLRAAARAAGLALEFPLREVPAGAELPAAVSAPGGGDAAAGVVVVKPPLPAGLPAIRVGDYQAAAGEVAYRCLVHAIDLALDGRVAAIATAPLAKHALHLAGHHYDGHTEILCRRTNSPEVGMFFWGPRLRVLLATTHVALARVPGLLTVGLLTAKVHLLAEFLARRVPADRRPIGIAALNPHAGEAGAFGAEEAEIIAPAVARMQAAGLAVDGPVPADVLFRRAWEGHYAAVVALYHDQGLGPFKLVHFRDGVQLTLGLPFVRTSADHGTAFDIAGRNCADHGSMAAAVRLALDLAAARQSAGKGKNIRCNIGL